MRQARILVGLALIGVVLTPASGGPEPGERGASEKPSADRGREALLTKSFTPPMWTFTAMNNAWKAWGASEKPADFDRLFRQRYGLHTAPYPNGELPMGLRVGRGLFGKGVANDCLLCHGGAIAGQSHIGLGNTSLDLQALYEELSALDGLGGKSPFPFSNVRGTTEAGAMTVYLYEFREPDLSLRTQGKLNLGPPHDLCEDVPAWWLLKKKKTMYWTGSTHARSVRALMQFMLTPLNSAEHIKRHEADFADIQAYLLSLEPPKYPFPIDERLAARGKELFVQTCARCHGTYGPEGKYPNKIVDLETIGTDPNRAHAFTEGAYDYFLRSWFGQETGLEGGIHRADGIVGYQAPPLDGIWASAPYFHNGSSPTVYHVLNSKLRPKVFTRSFRTEKEDYDPVKVGWKITELPGGPDPKLPAFERRKVYDTTQPGRANTGHPFGDKLTEEERLAVIEYLKTL